jgi:hypothetical protein
MQHLHQYLRLPFPFILREIAAWATGCTFAKERRKSRATFVRGRDQFPSIQLPSEKLIKVHPVRSTGTAANPAPFQSQGTAGMTCANCPAGAGVGRSPILEAVNTLAFKCLWFTIE